MDTTDATREPTEVGLEVGDVGSAEMPGFAVNESKEAPSDAEAPPRKIAKGHRPRQPSNVGDDVSILFSILLAVFDEKNLYEKMETKPAAADPAKFHSAHWVRFIEGCEGPWLQMSIPQKTKHLRWWLMKKFSMDPNLKCMLPGPGQPTCKRKPRNEMSWRGFEMSDAQLDAVVAEVMEAYQLGLSEPVL